MYKLGIDVGGTNTDAVLVDENRAVVADIKYPTSADIYDGILGAMRTVLKLSGVDPKQIRQAMLGTTQCTNAIVERKNLAPIGILRIGAPATTGIRPMVDWAEDIQRIAVGSAIIGGGFEYNGRELARAVTMSCGASVSVSLYPMSGRQMKEFGVHGIVTRSEQLGRAIRTIKDCGDKTPEAHFLELSEGYKLFKGKIADVLRETRAGFNFGKVVLEGIGEDKGGHAEVDFQNENLCATVNGEILATTPDLICLVDTETFTPVPTDALKYGKRVLVVGLPCYHLWRTEKGIELVGPRYFGLNTDYIPVEERCKG